MQTVYTKHRTSRSHTKSGPGRVHGQCRLIADPTTGAHLGVTAPKRRFPVAVQGGNWKGTGYVSYREHDRIFQLMNHTAVPESPQC